MVRREEMRGRGTVKGPGPTAMESITVQQSRSRHSRGDHGIAESITVQQSRSRYSRVDHGIAESITV
jgi:hypothetical protein